MISKCVYEDGDYWVLKDKKGFVVCKYNGVCGDVIGYSSTLEQAKEIIKLDNKKIIKNN